jgi:hypothetical protein
MKGGGSEWKEDMRGRGIQERKILDFGGEEALF